MATIKFSGFSAGGTGDAGTTQLVGYKVGDATANYRYSISDLATMLSPSMDNFYTADGTIGTTRKALITDTVQFRNAGDTKDVFSLNTTGAFALGLGATNTNYQNVCIGESAVTPTSPGCIAIGPSTSAGHSYAAMIGSGAMSTGSFAIGIGSYAIAGLGSIAIGHSSSSAGSYAVNIGYNSDGSASNAITLNASSGSAAPSTQYGFGVYMTSNTTPDFEVVGGGDSTLNTNLKVTGQSYSPINSITYADPPVLDWDSGSIQTVTLTGSPASAIAAPLNPKDGATYILIVKQDGTGSRTFAGGWDAVFNWKGGTAPTLSTGASAVDVLTFICDGTNYYGVESLDFS